MDRSTCHASDFSPGLTTYDSMNEGILNALLFFLFLLISSSCIPQSVAVNTYPFLNSQPFPIRDIHLDENKTLTIDVDFYFTWDENNPGSPAWILLLLNDKEIDRILPENGTEHLEKSILIPGIESGNYKLVIKQYGNTLEYLIAVNHSAALLLYGYGAGFLDDVDYFFAYAASTFISGKVYYFGDHDDFIFNATIKEGPRTLEREELNLTHGTFSWIGYSETASSKAVRWFSIEIDAGELRLTAGPFEVRQNPYPKIGDYFITPCCTTTIFLVVISMIILIVWIHRIRRRIRFIPPRL